MKKLYIFFAACMITSQLYAQGHLPSGCPVANAGPDITLNGPYAEIGYAEVVPGATYSWSPTIALTDPNVPNPAVMSLRLGFITSITYTLTMTPPNTNLVANGDFSQGNTGFATHYAYVTPIPGTTGWPDQYTITTNTLTMNTSYCPTGDHTTGSGNMMVIDGTGMGADRLVWGQNVAVQPNTTYTFSIDAAKLYYYNPTTLTININGTTIMTPTLENAPTCQWQHYQLTWNSEGNSTANIAIYTATVATSGNDFAIDDIKLFLDCPVTTDAVTITKIIGTPPTLPPGFPPIIHAKEASEEVVSDDVSIYPNPAQHEINILANQSVDSPVRIEMHDRYGRVVRVIGHAVMHNGGYAIDLQNIPAGIYTLSIQSQEGIKTKRFVLDK